MNKLRTNHLRLRHEGGEFSPKSRTQSDGCNPEQDVDELHRMLHVPMYIDNDQSRINHFAVLVEGITYPT